jgi:hypothetical protein
MPIDPGSISVNCYEDIEKQLPGWFYLNSDKHTRRGLQFCADRKLLPTFAIYEPGFIRLGAAHTAATAGVRTPFLSLYVYAKARLGIPT